jgi:hypothetical protein
MENFNFEKTIGGRLVAELRKELMQAIFVPNSMLKHGFDYSECEIDEHALYRNECVMVNGMVNGGLIEIDDLLED